MVDIASQNVPPNVREPALWKIDLGLLWSILFVFGGGLFALYYSNIGYIPDIKWEDLVVYIGALTIAGVFLFVLYFVLLFVPGWIWSEFLVFDMNLKYVLCDRDEPRWRRLLLDFGVPFAAFLLGVHFLLDSALSPAGIAFGVGVCLVLSSGIMAGLLNRSIRERTPKCEEEQDSKKTPKRKLLLQSAMLFAMSSLVSLLSILVFRYSLTAGTGGLMYLICTLTVTSVNLFVAVTCKKRFRDAIYVMAGAALILLALGDILVGSSSQKLSSRIMSKFGIGFDHRVTLLLTENGATILHRYKIPVDRPENRPQVGGVEILSRLGSEYFLRLPEEGFSFSFPKEEIVSWSFEKRGKAERNNSPSRVVPASNVSTGGS